ncbi:DUF5696 domain-containing protein [Halobacillus mangrovi]|uniref:DUF5696 domain-containing protein n=1 Tax=Halobacillus mangrovi TaxID=402384 RepID=UPI003D98DECF
MSNKWKWMVLIVILLFPVQVIATTLTDDEPKTDISEEEKQRSTKMLRYKSNQYTQPEDEEGSFEKDNSVEGYEKVAENDTLVLYVEEASLALKIENKQTGFIWNSGLIKGKEYNLNTMWSNMAHSALTIDYIDGDKTSSESILANESQVSLKKEENGFSATIAFEESEIALQLDVLLDGASIEVSVPHDKIVEGENKLATLRVYPFLGAVEGTDQDGYMFIPDGSGALMRFEEKQLASMSPYRASIYGEDRGFKRKKTETEEVVRVTPAHKVTMPVYGVTNGVDENAYVNVIEEGKNFADILAYPSGVSTDFHWITAQYNYRYQYYQPTSQNMSGFNVFQKDMNAFDIKERITFLNDEEANYVGMAQTYQQYLVENDVLKEGKDQVDIRLEFLGGEMKEGLLWDSVQPMTPVKDLPDYVKRLQQQGVEDMHVTYRGWSEGGLTGTLPEKFPLESKVGSNEEFKEVNDFFKNENVPLYYYTDYTKAYEGANGFSGRTDVARKINSETIASQGEEEAYFYLSPEKSLEIAKKDIAKYEENEIRNLAVDTSANALFSDFNHQMKRPEVMTVYQNMFEVLSANMESLALYQPNDYLLSETDRYLDIPMYSSNYNFVTDTVPFMQIVLKGYIPYYASFSNFHYNPVDEVLRMIEYGAYPSFYLTTEPSHELMHTPSEDLYTSEFKGWEKEIVDQYKKVKQSLGQVEGAKIINRKVHQTGVVEVGYSNGKAIVVNYTSEDVKAEEFEVEAKGYQVIDRGNES